jgi:hypothetical protein
MTGNSSEELIRTQLYSLMEEIFEQVHGFALDKGTSLGETLATLTAEEASRPIVDGGTSIAAQTEHICFYMDVLLDYMQGIKVEGIDWSKSWNVRKLTTEAWNGLKRRLQQTYQQVMILLKSSPAWDTEEKVNGAIGILAHTAYHLGSIRQILKVVKA